MRPLKIGLDYHKVIDIDYDFYRNFTNLAIKKGHQVFILTGGPLEDVKKTLLEHKIVFSEIFAIFDFFKAQGLITKEGLIDPEKWNKAKADYCKEHKIDFHLDDKQEYCRHIESLCCIFDEKSKTCDISGKKFSLHSPEQFLSEIESQFKS